MGATALVQYGLHQAFGKNNPTDRVVNAVKKYTAAPAVPAPPDLPPPPSALQANIDASKAMTEAAQRYRRQKGAGFSSTILTTPATQNTPAPTSRKSLLGI